VLNFQISRRHLAAVCDLLVFDDLVEAVQSGAFHRRNVNEDILAAGLRLNEPIAFLAVELLHGTLRYYLLHSNRRSLPCIALFRTEPFVLFLHQEDRAVVRRLPHSSLFAACFQV
jgi:hypothetical protein